MSGVDEPPRYVKPKAAEAHFGVDRRTLKKWADAGHIRFLQPGGAGQRLYDISTSSSRPAPSGAGHTVSAVAATQPTARPSPGVGTVVSSVGVGRVDAIYGRVSTRKQLDDLERQLATLRAAHPGAREFSDCASGLNFKRKGLKAVLQLAFEKRLRYVYVAHKDRLCRFAYDLVEHVLDKHGAKIVVDAQ
eukprot:4731096-Prymnesium_polylepis.1